jgi:hypothetical protein
VLSQQIFLQPLLSFGGAIRWFVLDREAALCAAPKLGRWSKLQI